MTDAAARGRRPLALVFAVAIATFAALFAVHRDLALFLGNPEWDYLGQNYTRGEGVIERTSSLVDALRPDGRYGQGYAVATWLGRSTARGLGIEIDEVRGATLATAAFSGPFLAAAWRLRRA